MAGCSVLIADPADEHAAKAMSALARYHINELLVN